VWGDVGLADGTTLGTLYENRLVISDCCGQTSAILPVSLAGLARDRTPAWMPVRV